MLAAGANPDETFATKAAQGGMAEVKLGQLAVSKAQDKKVKDFGQKMVDDHSKANDELKGIAKNKSITLPTDVSVKDNATYTELSALSGKEFDRAYINDMVKDHETDVAEFQREANNGKDSDIKGFAAKTLPTLQQHLQMAKDAASEVTAAK